VSGTAVAEPRRCACGTELAPALLACPACRRLVHRQRLEELARRAETAEEAVDFPAALVAWREALELLPAESGQARAISPKASDRFGRSPMR
jgi:hypothetical protein